MHHNKIITLGVRPCHLSIANKGITVIVEVSELMKSDIHLHASIKRKDIIAIVPSEGKEVNFVEKELSFAFSGQTAHIFSFEGKNLKF